MRIALPVTLVCAAFAAAVWCWLPEHRLVGLSTLALMYFGFFAWGTASLRSGIFCAAATCGPPGRGVALTYDDGPDPESTPALRQLLSERGVKVAFFCVGQRVKKHQDLVRGLALDGHLLANHSHRHSVFTNFYFGRRLERELQACQDAVREVTATTPKYYRPPFGLANHALRGVTRRLGLAVVGWQVRGFDSRTRDPDAVARRILSRVRDGGIVLLHDGGRDGEAVVRATRAVLDGLAERGLRTVRLDELLEGQPLSQKSP